MCELRLNPVSQNTSNLLGDVIFIHGLGGDAINSWKSEHKAGKGEAKAKVESFFPAVLATDFPELNFWSLDYSAHLTKWGENPNYNELQRICSEITEFLLGKKIGNKPILFVTHSLGGIVAKQVLKISLESRSKRLNKLFTSTKAVSFIATPHKGSRWADYLKAINSIFPFIRASVRIDELLHDNVYLEGLTSWYRDNTLNGEIETQAFFERKNTHGIMIVPHYSANPEVSGCTPIPINENHISISKPKTKESPLYVMLSGLINYSLLENTTINLSEFSPKTMIPPQTVLIGIVKKGNSVLMVRRRYPINNLTWQFVAGRLKVGEEEEEECIIREIKEETNINVKVIEKLGELEDSDSPYLRVYFSCKYLSGKIKNGDGGENTEVAWVKINKVKKHVTSKLSKIATDYLNI